MKKSSIVIIAILCVISILFVFCACQKGGDDATPSGQPSGNAPSGSIDSGETIPSGSIDSGSIDSGDTTPSGSVDSGEVPSGEPSPDLPSGEIESGETGSGEQPPEPVYVKSITDLIENYSDIVYSALNDYYLESIGRECMGRTFNTSKVLSVSWDIGNSDEISKIDLIIRYLADPITERYIICTANFDTDINVRELNKDNIRDTFQSKVDAMTSSQSYSFMYDTTIQSDRANLTKAICDKVFGENESATRYIVDRGYTGTDNILGEVHNFDVIEITDKVIKETHITIKNASSEEGFIANLENESYYYIHDDKSYTLSGNKITQ